MPIKVENLSYTYLPGTPFEYKALEEVNFEIQDGEFVGIVGHTGSGKSTLVQIISGLVKGYQGDVYINGTNFQDKKADKMLLRRTVGVVFQYPEYQLFEETVEKDISYGPQKLGVPPEEIPARVKAALTLVGMDYETFRNQSPFALSGGQKRKVAIAGVLVMRPSILIMDEPIAGLDPAGRKNLMDLSRKLNQNGTTILMITHDMDSLAEYADRVLVLNKGRLYLNGTPEQIFSDREKIISIGLDFPQAASFAEMLRSRGVDVPQGIIRYTELKDFLIKRFGGRA